MSDTVSQKESIFFHALDIFQEDSSGYSGMHLIGISGQKATGSCINIIRCCGLAQVLALASLSMPVHHLHFSYAPISATRS